MKATLLLLFVCVAAALAAVPFTSSEVKGYPRFIPYTDAEGNEHMIDLEEEPDYELLAEVKRNPANNLYLLFTRANPTSAQTLVMNNAASIRNSNFNPNAPTLVISHGWLSNHNTDLNPEIRDAMLIKSNVNIIVLDWRRLAISNYVTAAKGVPDVGRGLGQFINFVCQTTGANLNSFHIVGFSLGAHVAGNAGRELGGRVARVTGLDPAGPLFNYNSECINANDAVYVEGIHTDGGLNGLGIGTNIGDADFYPNGGTNQPGCLTGICDHNRAWELFIATINYSHLVGHECASNLQMTMNNCRGKTLPMGNDDLRKYGTGTYRVNTSRRYPF